MSADYQGQDPMVIAKQAERDLNSQAAKQPDVNAHAHAASDSSKICNAPSPIQLQH